jgi:hypothetical protein
MLKMVSPYNSLTIERISQKIEPEYFEECEDLLIRLDIFYTATDIINLIEKFKSLKFLQICKKTLKYNNIEFNIGPILEKADELCIPSCHFILKNFHCVKCTTTRVVTFKCLQFNIVGTDYCINPDHLNVDTLITSIAWKSYPKSVKELVIWDRNRLSLKNLPQLKKLQIVTNENFDNFEITTLESFVYRFNAENIDSNKIANIIRKNKELKRLTISGKIDYPLIIDSIQQSNISNLGLSKDIPIEMIKLDVEKLSLNSFKYINQLSDILPKMKNLKNFNLRMTPIQNGDDLNRLLLTLASLPKLENVDLYFHIHRNYTEEFDDGINVLLSKGLKRLTFKIKDVKTNIYPETVINVNDLALGYVETFPTKYNCEKIWCRINNLKNIPKPLPCLKNIMLEKEGLDEKKDILRFLTFVNESNITWFDMRITSDEMKRRDIKKVFENNYKICHICIGKGYKYFGNGMSHECIYNTLKTIKRRNKKIAWNYVCKKILNVVLQLAPLKLPTYVVLEIIDTMGDWKHINQYKKVNLISAVMEGKKVEYW